MTTHSGFEGTATSAEDKLRSYLKRVTAELKQTRERLVAAESKDTEPIAIVGMACRFPGGMRSPEDLWRAVVAGEHPISDFPADRGWDVGGLYDPSPGTPGKSYARVGGFLHDAAEFDAEFFGMPPRVATATDPQHRLVLETSWEAFERAGVAADVRGSDTGVFLGSTYQDYISRVGAPPADMEGYLLTGSTAGVASGRVSYVFGLTGPAVTVDTACSSSLVALHLACQSLRSGECSLALAGGVTVMATPGVFVEFSRQGGLAPDGRCKAFADAADGTSFAEGVGMVVVERLSDAVHNGHQVLAVVRGSAVNQDGASNGLTAPNGVSQEKVIRQALANAGAAASDVDVVEAHGTGTRLGDPIEAAALLATYGRDRLPDRPLWLGSVKSNIGHTQAAAGIAGVIKMVQAMRHGVLPATLHVDQPSREVDWSSGGVRLLIGNQSWPERDRPRRAGVSAFGISGTNAHVILEQAPVVEVIGLALPSGVATAWLMSARSRAGVRAQAARLAEFVGDDQALDPAAVAWSLATTRSTMPYRAVVTGSSRAELLSGLAEVTAGVAASTDVGVGFVFSGQGGQRLGMGRELADRFPVFAEALDEVCAHLDPYLPVPLREVLFGESSGLLGRTVFTQAGVFAVQVALVRLLGSWGVRPECVLGHSVGEIAAVYAAGVLSLADAARLVAVRGGLMQGLPEGGAMVAVAAGEDDVLAVLGGRAGVDLAAVNGPYAVVVSGEADAVAAVAVECGGRGWKTTSLSVDRAFHSFLMDPVLSELDEVAAGLSWGPGSGVVVVSATSGEVVNAAELAAPGYWSTQARYPVRFMRGVRAMAGAGPRVMVEIGPDTTLANLIPQILDGHEDVTSIGLLRRAQGETDMLLVGMGRMWSSGALVEWPTVLTAEDDRVSRMPRVELPTYAFQRRRYWLEPVGRDGGGLDRWRYQVMWSQLPEVGKGALSGRWLIVTPDGESVPRACVDALRALGGELVEAGLADLGVADWSGVVVFPGCTGDDLDAGVVGLVEAVRADVGARVWCVTSAGVSVGTWDGPVDVGSAMVWGAGRVVGLELPGRWGGLVDVPVDADVSVWRQAWSLIAAGVEDQVAVRPAGVFGRRVVPMSVSAGGPVRLSGSVLITGGTGGLGAVVAGWVVEQGAEHVVLVSRRGEDAPGAKELRRELEAAGAAVTIAACDVADRAELAAVLASVPERWPLSAVYHTAGVGSLCPVKELSASEIVETIRAKVVGARNLDELVAGSVGTFVVFSSVAGVWGSGGQAAYAAANAGADAVVANRVARGWAGASIAWGLWAGAGMARQDEASTAQLVRRGVVPMDPRVAVTALARPVSGVVADIAWDRFLPVFTSGRPSPLFALLPQASQSPQAERSGSTLAQQLKGQPEPEQRRIVLGLVSAQVAAVLGYPSPDSVDVSRSFRDLGFDSLMAVELRDRLSQETGLRLSATLVFDHPTPNAVARFMLGEHDDAVATPPPGPVDEPIAIVGMACRFAGGIASPEDLWDLVANGANAVSEFPSDRGWDLDSLYHPDPDHQGTSYTRRGGFLYDAAYFDPEFFGISPREALAMDPQQRLLLETTWESLERASIDPTELMGSSTGVYIGLASSVYDGHTGAMPPDVEGHLITGNTSSVASGRIAYSLGLEGPAVSVETACSSSLVALHLAAQSLRSGECSLALVGGVVVMSTPESFVGFSRQRALSADGLAKAFSDDADGTGFAEGVGVVVVERLSDARRNGHRVLALVRGSAVNQDGASNGLTAPSGPSQQRVILRALANAGLAPDEVDVVEAHGTGTKLGDPIEAQALQATYGRDRDAANPLWLGSVKSNIGHTQAAAGVAGVIKMVQAMRHGVLPASLHVGMPSREVDWSAGTVRLLTEARSWPEAERPRRAGVSAFGISGTNAHVILEQAPPDIDNQPDSTPGVLPGRGRTAWLISARTHAGLRAQAARLAEFARQRPDVGIESIGRSLATTRAALPCRAVVTGDDRDELLTGLSALEQEAPRAAVPTGSNREGHRAGVVFVFPGQGSQWIGMAVELWRDVPVFADSMRSCEHALSAFVDWSLHGVLHQAPGAPSIRHVNVVQPVLWAVMVSLAAVWRACGVEPDAVIGHSQGEIAAACVAGLLTLDDGARIVAERSKAWTELAGKGGMAAMALPLHEVVDLLDKWDGRLSVAAVNAPRATVVSGDPAALDELVTDLTGRGIRARRIVGIDTAGHSAQVDVLQERVLGTLSSVDSAPGHAVMISTVTARPVEPHGLRAPYWYRNLREPVLFEEGIRLLTEQGNTTFVEISPHPILTAALADVLDAAGVDEPLVASTLRRDEPELAAMTNSLEQAWAAGVAVDWRAVLGTGSTAADPPTYAFQRQRYWLASDVDERATMATQADTGVVPDQAETVLWEAIEQEDLAAVAAIIAPSSDVRPAEWTGMLTTLARWRRRQRQQNELDSWRYGIEWMPLPDGDDLPAPTGCWLVVTLGGRGVGAWGGGAVEGLQAIGVDVVVIEVDGVVDRGVVAGLVAGAVASRSVDGVVVLAGAAADGRAPDVGVVWELLAVVQGLGDVGVEARMWCVTCGGVSVGSWDELGIGGVGQSAVWGVGRVVALEMPDRWGGLVDVPSAGGERVWSRVVRLLGGSQAGVWSEDEVAVRLSGVLGRRLAPAPAPAPAVSGGGRLSGSVLVTGGTDGLGAVVARWVVGRGAEHVVLVSRRGGGTPGAEELRKDLKATGAAVTIVACDVSDRAGLAAVVQGIPREWPLRGVFHVAGLLADGAVESLDSAGVAAALGAKAESGWWLHELTCGLRSVEEFVVYSSVAGVVGNAGQGVHGAASAFVDGLVMLRRASGLPALSVAWGPWSGAGHIDDDLAERLRRRGLRPMPYGKGMLALERALELGDTCVTIADVDWNLFLPSVLNDRPTKLLDRFVPRQTSKPVAVQSAGNSLSVLLTDASSPSQRDKVVLDLVTNEVAAVLGYDSTDAVHARRGFLDMGFDSIMAVRLRNRLNSITGLRLPSTVIFDHPTPTKLTQYLVGELSDDEPSPDDDLESANAEQVLRLIREEFGRVR